MKALLWKDYRLYRGVLLLGAAIAVLPFPVAMALVWHEHGLSAHGRLWAEALVSAGQLSASMSMLTVGLLGGNAFAVERADRSAEFLAYLPPSRGEIVISKLIVAGMALIAILAVHGIVFFAIVPWLAGAGENMWTPAESVGVVLGTITALFGVGWGFSAVLESATGAIGLGFTAPITVAVLLFGAERVFGWPNGAALETSYVAGCAALGIAAFSAGTFAFLQRG